MQITEVASSSTDAFHKTLRTLYFCGEDVEIRGLKTKEIIDFSIIIENKRNFIENIYINSIDRKLSFSYLFGELEFYLSGSNKLSDISRHSSFWSKISDDGETVNSAYGYKIFGKDKNLKPSKVESQFKYAYECLKKDYFSRKAIIQFYSTSDADLETKDNCCTMYLQFLLRDGKLICIANMRSNDIMYGFSYDITFFQLLQIALAEKLGVKIGQYIHKVGSMHIYEKHFDMLKKIRPAGRQIDTEAICDVNLELDKIKNRLIKKL